MCNRFRRQQPKIRIEALYSGDNDDCLDSMKILDFDEDAKLVLNCKYDVGHMNLDARRSIAVWLFGDGKGETVNIRLHSPRHIISGYSDHYIKVDFLGWRHFVFYEFQNCEKPHEDWPPMQMEYRDFTDVIPYYAVYSTGVNYKDISEIEIMVNREGVYNLRMKSILAVPHREVILKDPSVSIGENEIKFKTALKSGNFLEYTPEDGKCVVYDMLGNVLDLPEADGKMPFLKEGFNNSCLRAASDMPYQKRAAVTFRTAGSLL